MKDTHIIDLEKRAYTPLFLKKSWYKKTIKELNSSKISAENGLIYGLAWARIAATAMQDKIDVKRYYAERDAEHKAVLVEKALKTNKLTIEEIADISDASIDFVLVIKAKMTQH
jgi:DNA-dependent RNA polymerase auxiliary subunit epsilon